MSSTVSSLSCVELKDSDLDAADTIGDGAKAGGGVATGTGGVKTVMGGGALLGGEPED